MSDIAIPKNKIHIRLTDEPWQHITTGHPEMADYYYEILETVENPYFIYEGNYGGLIAVGAELNNVDKFLVVIYKELEGADGFIITAYCSNKIQQFSKKRILWKKQ